MNGRFVIISERLDDELFIHPTFPDLKRSDEHMVVTVTTGTSRTVEQKLKLAELVTRYAVEKLGVSQDDVTLMMYVIHLENMSFGGENLVSIIDLSMPWANKKIKLKEFLLMCCCIKFMI